MFPQMPTNEKTCTKCSAAPALKDDSYCKDCRNEYQKQRRENEEWRIERRGLIRGVRAMRAHVAEYFKQWSGRPFMGAEVAAVVELLPGPAIADEQPAQS